MRAGEAPCRLGDIELVLIFQEDWLTLLGGIFTRGTAKVRVRRRDGQWDWLAAQARIETLTLAGQRFRSLTVVGHGWIDEGGRAGGFERGALQPGTPAAKLLSFIKAHLGAEARGVELRTCNSARDEDGRRFIEQLANAAGMTVKGWDDWYAIVPHGREWTAPVGGEAQESGDTRRRFRGTRRERLLGKLRVRWGMVAPA